MQRPEIRMIQNQEITTTTDVSVSNSEAAALLAKYGYNTNYTPQVENPIIDPNRNLTFEEMLAIEENKLKAEKQRTEILKQQELNRPHAYTFNDRNVNYHNTQFKSLDDTNIGIQVQIVSDMNINRGYGY